MSAKLKGKRYVCENCGYISSKWLGRCPNCLAWNSFRELTEPDHQASGGRSLKLSASRSPLPITSVNVETLEEMRTQIGEVDRVLGGRIVQGSLILLAGEPGIGKSTLALQIALSLSSQGKKVLYATAEERASQVKLRFDRIKKGFDGLTDEGGAKNLHILEAQNLGEVLSVADDYQLVVVDSVQTFYLPDLDSPPSNISQVKAIAHELMTHSKVTGTSYIALAHVTKEGLIAGPKYLEHMVDVVLMLETYESFRVLRAVKNRYGRSGEIGLFEMTPFGLKEVPSVSWLTPTGSDPGVVPFITLEGLRPIALEIQALVTKSYLERPKRLSWGLDPVRLNVILSIINKYLNLKIYQYDVIVNVNGAVSLWGQDSDLAVAASVLSSLYGKPVGDLVFLGRLSLQGRVLPVPNLPARLEEAKRLKIKGIITSRQYYDKLRDDTVEIIYLDRVEELKSLIRDH